MLQFHVVASFLHLILVCWTADNEYEDEETVLQVWSEKFHLVADLIRTARRASSDLLLSRNLEKACNMWFAPRAALSAQIRSLAGRSAAGAS